MTSEKKKTLTKQEKRDALNHGMTIRTAWSPAKNMDLDVMCRYKLAVPVADMYMYYIKNGKHLPNPVPPLSLDDRKQMEDVEEIFSLGYLCKILQSWSPGGVDEAVKKHGLPTFAQVASAKQSFKFEPKFVHDGVAWRSIVRVFARPSDNNVLVVHLPNDGKFYVADELLPILGDKHHHNPSHSRTCPDNWVWPQLKAFEEFASVWASAVGFGDKKMRLALKYHADANRLDICFDWPSDEVGLEFSFEPGFPLVPVPEAFWYTP